MQQTRREQHFIDLLQPTLNMINAINENPTEKERIRKIKTICSCGAEISNGSMEWHQKSKKHKPHTLDF